jgi:hypothetical protein
MTRFVFFVAVAVASLLGMQEVTKPQVDGVRNFARLETTVACAGATSALHRVAPPAMKAR